MDQTFAEQGCLDRPTLTPLRLALMAVAAIAGGFILSLALNTSSASAAESDDPLTGPVTGLVDSVVTPVTTTVASVVQDTPVAPAVAPVVAPATHTVDAVVAPVTEAVDQTLAAITPPSSMLPSTVLLRMLGIAAPTIAAAPSAPTAPEATEASAAVAFVVAISGTATGVLDLGILPTGDTSILTGPSSAGGALALAAAFSFVMLLIAIRRRSDSDAIPASPVFDTDCSPD